LLIHNNESILTTTPFDGTTTFLVVNRYAFTTQIIGVMQL
jgi:hypothetical protein